MNNMNFGKLVNGNIVFAPRMLVIDGEHLWTNDASTYLEQGWKRVVRTSRPSSSCTESWTEDDYTITQSWNECLEISLEDRISDLEAAICELSNLLRGE